METFDEFDHFGAPSYEDEAYEFYGEEDDEFLASDWADDNTQAFEEIWSDEETGDPKADDPEPAPPNAYAAALDNLLEVTQPLTWTDDAACKSSGIDFFNEHAARQVKPICAACPAVRPCLEHALRHPLENGIWGGTTSLQRIKLQQALRRNWLTVEQILDLPQEKLVESLSMLTMSARKITALLEDDSTPLENDFLRSALEKFAHHRQQATRHKAIRRRQRAAEQLTETITPILWDDQVECLNAVKVALAENRSRIFFQMSPSRGKTTVAAMAVKEVLASNPEARVAFLCHRKHILSQARDRFQAMIGNDLTYGMLTRYTNDEDLNETTCVFATFQTLNLWRERFAPNAFDIIVVDESHNALAPTYNATIDYFLPQTYLAMTATPRRADMLDSQDIFGKAVYTQSLAENFVNGRLARPYYKVIIGKEEEAYWRAHNISPSDIDRRVFIPAREEEMIRITQQEIKASGIKQPRILAFTNTVEHANRIANLLPGAKAWHSDSPDTIHDFQAGTINALVAVGMADEGVDVPDINILLFFNRTDSERKFIQQLGRGARKTAGKDSMLVLDFAANCDRLFMVDKLATDMLHIEDSHALDTPKPPAEQSKRTHPNRQTQKQENEIRVLHGGTFVYTPAVVKIIERIHQLDQETLPEGWISTASFAKNNDISSQLLFRLLSDMNIRELPTFRTKYNHVVALNPELQAKLLATPELQTKRAPEDIASMPQFARQIGVEVKRLKTVMKHEGIDIDQLPRYKFHSVTTIGIPADIQVRIRMSSLIAESLPIPEGWVSVEKFSQLMQTHRSVIRRLIKAHDLSIIKRRVGSVIAPVLSPEQQTFLQEQYDFSVQPAPDGWVGILTFAQKNHMSDKTVRKIIEKYNIQTERYKYGTVVTDTLSPWSQQCILKIVNDIEPPLRRKRKDRD